MFTKNLKKVMFTFFTALAFIFLLGACQFGNVSQELVDARSDLKEAAARVLVKGEETKTITLTDDINLNGFIVGGATVKWESSNEKYAQVVPNTEDNNYVLKVRRPKPNEETVTLTLKATISLDYLDADGETKTLSTVKRFTVEITPSPAPKSLSEVKVEAAEAIKNNKEYNASFYGTVTYVIPGTGNGQFYVTDGETSMYVFVAKEGIKAGDVVNVQGKIVEYYGMLEVDKSNAKVEILTANEEGQYVDDEGQVIFGSDGTPLKAVTPTYTETTVVDLYDTEKYPNAVAYSGNTVNVYGLLTYEKYRGESNTNFYLVDVESGKRLAIYYKSYTDEQKKVLETFAGKYVTIDAIAHDFYTSAPGPFRRLLVNADSVKEAAAPVLTNQQQADYIIGTLFLSESYGVDFTLPTEATWEVVSGTGIEIVDGVAKVTKTEAEQTVVLKATVKVNDAVATKEFTVVVESLKIEYITPSEALENLQKDEFNGKTVYVKGFISQGTYSNENFLNKYGNFFLKGTDGVEVKIYGKFGKDAQGNYVFPTLKEQLGLAEGVCVGIKGTYSNGFGNIEGLEIITVEIPELTDKEKADAIASKLTLKGAYGADFTLPTEATWEVVSGTGIEIVDGVAKVTKTEAEQTVVLKATVKVNDAVATKEFTVVVESLNQAAMTVAEVLALADDASVKVVAKVVAIYARGYVVADNTGNVLVYFGSSFSQDFNIGDVVLVEGTKGTFNKGVQIASPTVTASTETVELTETAPKELTAADLEAYASSTTVTVELVKLTGKLTISNNKYYNVAIDGTSKQGSIAYPLTGLVDSNLNGKNVVVTGYVFSVSGTNYINIMALSVAEVELTDAEKVAEALAKVTAPATATEDFTLVEVEGVVWSLKAESVAATLAGNTVKVTRQSTDTEIVIVATATFGEVTDSKEFTVTVLAEGTVVTEKTLTIDFSTATGTGTQVSDAATFVNTYASVNILKSATATNVYDGNGAGGKWENTKGLVKMGTSKKNGVLTLTFNEGVKVSKVVLNCYAWNSGKTDKVTVGTSTVALPNGDAAEDLEFTLGGVNEFTITSAKRMFLFSITVSYTE